MRYLTLAALVLLATPALAQTGASSGTGTPAAPDATTANPVPCNCGPAPARTAVRRVRIRRTTPVYPQTPAVTAYTPAPFAFDSSATAPAPAATIPVTPGGILGAVSQYDENIVYYGLGYTDGYIGAEGGSGGSGPLHAGY